METDGNFYPSIFFFFFNFPALCVPLWRAKRKTHVHTQALQIENSSPSDNSRYVSKEPSSANVSERAVPFCQRQAVPRVSRGIYFTVAERSN